MKTSTKLINLVQWTKEKERFKLLKSEMKMETVPDSMEIKRTIGECYDSSMLTNWSS